MKKSLLSYLRLITYYVPAFSTGFLTLAVFASLITGAIRAESNPPIAVYLFYILIICAIVLLLFLTILAIWQCLMCLSEQNGTHRTTGQPSTNWIDILCIPISGVLLVLFDWAIRGRFFFTKTLCFNGGSISISVDYEGLVFIALVLLVAIRQIIITHKILHNYKSTDANTGP